MPKRRCFSGRVQASGAARAGGQGEDEVESEEDGEDEGEDGEADEGEGSGTEDGDASDDEDADDEDGGTSGSETSAESAVSSDWDVLAYVAGYVGVRLGTLRRCPLEEPRRGGTRGRGAASF